MTHLSIPFTVRVVDAWRATRLFVSSGPIEVDVFWGEDTAPPAGAERVGARLEVPAGVGEHRQWQSAAEAYVAELADAAAERDAARVMPKPPFWWTRRRRWIAQRDAAQRADTRYDERVGVAVEAYRPHREEVRALLAAQDRAAWEEAQARRKRVYMAFYTWHKRHDGNRTLAERACWRSTVDGDTKVVDLGGESDAYTLAAEVAERVRFTPDARAAVQAATGDDAEVWWTWVHGTARNLHARDQAVARLREAAEETAAALRAAGSPHATEHVGDSSPKRTVTGWLVRFDTAALTPPPVPMPPEEALRSGTFSAHLVVPYGPPGMDLILTTSGEIARTVSNSAHFYVRHQRLWTYSPPDRFAGIALNGKLYCDGPSGHHIHFEYPLTHLVEPELFIPYVDTASHSMAATFRALVHRGA
jgi:hypothetical protein